MKKSAKYIAVNAVVAALYVALTVPFGALATNPYIQIRPGEALTILPALMPYCIPGLAIGCAIGNIVSTFGIWDIILGTLITTIAALLTAFVFKKFYFAPLPPILLNAFLLPLVWLLAGTDGMTWLIYLMQVGGLLVSQSVVCYGLGIPLYFLAKKRIVPMLRLDEEEQQAN